MHWNNKLQRNTVLQHSRVKSKKPWAEYSNSRQKCQQLDVGTRRTSQRNTCNTTEPLPVGSPGTGDTGETPGGARRQLPVAKLHPGSHKHTVVQNLLPRRHFLEDEPASSKTELASCSGRRRFTWSASDISPGPILVEPASAGPELGRPSNDKHKACVSTQPSSLADRSDRRKGSKTYDDLPSLLPFHFCQLSPSTKVKSLRAESPAKGC